MLLPVSAPASDRYWPAGSPRDDPKSLKTAIAVGYVVAIAGVAVTAPLISLPMVLLGSMVRSLGSGVVWVFSTQLLLQVVPDRVRGRVFASDYMFFYLGSALSSSVIGAALDTRPGDIDDHLGDGGAERRADGVVDGVGCAGEEGGGLRGGHCSFICVVYVCYTRASSAGSLSQSGFVRMTASGSCK